MRTPKPPIGFVPVDSEEARGIDPTIEVNFAFVDFGRWRMGRYSIDKLREMAQYQTNMHYHVQLPPPVEWEEVWGWEMLNTRPQITRYGIIVEELYWKGWTDNQLNTIVRALNEMEGQNG